MPSRMPNWKMRANALVDGKPDDEALQDAEPGIDLHDPHQTQMIASGGHEAVGIERDREFVAGCPSARRTRGCCRP